MTQDDPPRLPVTSLHSLHSLVSLVSLHSLHSPVTRFSPVTPFTRFTRVTRVTPFTQGARRLYSLFSSVLFSSLPFSSYLGLFLSLSLSLSTLHCLLCLTHHAPTPYLAHHTPMCCCTVCFCVAHCCDARCGVSCVGVCVGEERRGEERRGGERRGEKRRGAYDLFDLSHKAQVRLVACHVDCGMSYDRRHMIGVKLVIRPSL